MKVTTLEDLKRYSEGTILELPAFAEGQPLIVRVKRVSLMGLLKEGKIPNKLYSAVMKVFGLDNKKENLTIDTLKENTEVMELIAKDCLLEPTFEEFKNAGIKLTDEQLLGIFNFAQTGVNDLESFRTE